MLPFVYLAAIPSSQVLVDGEIDRFGKVMHTAIGKRKVRPAGMVAAKSEVVPQHADFLRWCVRIATEIPVRIQIGVDGPAHVSSC